MKVQFDHLLLSSFKEWFNHTLLKEGEAWRNVSSGRLYETADKQFKNYDVFTAPFHQWVYDTSIVGANIPSGVYINSAFTARGTDNLRIDFNRGRAILDEDSNNGNIVAADYAVKEFNIYITSKSDERLIVESQFEKRPIRSVVSTGLNPRSLVMPAVFLRQSTSNNQPWSFGGEDLTTSTVRAIIFSDNEYRAVGVKSLFRDKRFTTFCLLDNTPINEFGDIKSGNSWNYNNAVTSDTVIINDVVVSDIDNDQLAQHQPGLFVSIIEFELIKSRYPRQ